MGIKEKIPLDTRRKIANSINDIIWNFSVKSYSQEGEDLVLQRIFNDKQNGFYVDIGAFHPKRFSNTYFFYKKGWVGINIDAMPGSMKKFNSIRKKDINIELPVSNVKEILTYYIFNEPALNTFSKNLAESRNGKYGYRILEKRKIETIKLSEILDKYLPNNINDIDFMSIDVETLDYEVLLSNDWEKYSPKIILIEDLKFDINNLNNSDINKLLVQNNYTFFAKTVNTIFYKRNDFLLRQDDF